MTKPIFLSEAKAGSHHKILSFSNWSRKLVNVVHHKQSPSRDTGIAALQAVDCLPILRTKLNLTGRRTATIQAERIQTHDYLNQRHLTRTFFKVSMGSSGNARLRLLRY